MNNPMTKSQPRIKLQKSARKGVGSKSIKLINLIKVWSIVIGVRVGNK